MTTTITAGMVKELREATSAGMMDCKRVLEETGGDIEEATRLLRERGIAKAGKLAGRATTEGRVEGFADGKVGVLVEVGCNTDFVSKNDDFVAFTRELAQLVAEQAPADVDALLALPKGDGTVEDWRTNMSSTTGENVEIRRFERYEAGADGRVESYIHGGKIGVLVELAGPGANSEAAGGFAKELAMHAAAMSPKYLTSDEIPAADIEAEKQIYIAQAADKPENIREKIAEGKLGAWFKEVSLLHQLWVKGKDVFGKDTSIDEWRKNVAKDAGGDIEIRRFTRYQLGETAAAPSGDDE